jgi:hypothetical protein
VSVNDRAKLRAIAEHHAWELSGFSTILWPLSARRLATLREAWLEVEPDARAGRLTGGLGGLNYGHGERPRAFWEWTRPMLAHLQAASPEDRVSGLHAAGELTRAELAEFGLEARS